MFENNRFHEGMTVRSADGDKLGKVTAVDAQGIRVAKGIFFPKEYLASLDQVDQINGDEIYLKWSTALVEQQHDAVHGVGDYHRETQDEQIWGDFRNRGIGVSGAHLAAADGAMDKVANSTASRRTIPLREEELQVEKRGMKDIGRVRIFKTIKTEDKHFTVPIRREEVTIERVAATAAEQASSASSISDLKSETITIPIREEEVVLNKRAVLRENVQVRTSAEEIRRELSGSVRKEEVRIEREGGPLDSERSKGFTADRFENFDQEGSLKASIKKPMTELTDDAAILSDQIKRQRKAS